MPKLTAWIVLSLIRHLNSISTYWLSTRESFNLMKSVNMDWKRCLYCSRNYPICLHFMKHFQGIHTHLSSLTSNWEIVYWYVFNSDYILTCFLTTRFFTPSIANCDAWLTSFENMLQRQYVQLQVTQSWNCKINYLSHITTMALQNSSHSKTFNFYRACQIKALKENNVTSTF